MHQTLLAFIAAHERKPWQPGRVDCCLALASWALWLGHCDPAADLRETYDSEEGFRSIVAQAGGVVPLVESCVIRINGKRTQMPFCGSIGVIGSATNIHKQFGAIFDGEQWLVRLADRFAPMTARQLAVWSI